MKKINITGFSLKFIDIMIGIVLGLGFQWWTNLKEPWQFVAFIFAYITIVDYWIDYGPSLRKFPPQKEIDVFLDLAICFSLFLYIYTTQLTIIHFVLAFGLIRFFDFFWLLSSKVEYKPTGFEKKYVDTWLITDLIETILAVLIAVFAIVFATLSITTLVTLILMLVITRTAASMSYKKIFLAN